MGQTYVNTRSPVSVQVHLREADELKNLPVPEHFNMLHPPQGEDGVPGPPGAPGIDGHPVKLADLSVYTATLACLSALMLSSVFPPQGLPGPRGPKVIKCLRCRSGAVFFSNALF